MLLANMYQDFIQFENKKNKKNSIKIKTPTCQLEFKDKSQYLPDLCDLLRQSHFQARVSYRRNDKNINQKKPAKFCWFYI